MTELSKQYGSHTILDQVNLEVYPGELICIFGASGGGKSTLLNIIGTLEDYHEGRLECFNKLDPVQSEKTSELLRRTKIAYLFQNFALVDNMTVKENMMLAVKYSQLRNKGLAIDQALMKVGREDKQESKVYELSGGQQQRLALARNMVKPFDLMLADEPTGSLDEANKLMVMQTLLELNHEGKTIVVVSHDNDFKTIASKNYLIKNKKVERVL